VDLYCELCRGEQSKFCKVLDGKLLLTALYDLHPVTLNELKAILKMSAQEGQNDAVNKTSVESTVQDKDFRK
jgi:hypothetical protein